MQILSHLLVSTKLSQSIIFVQIWQQVENCIVNGFANLMLMGMMVESIVPGWFERSETVVTAEQTSQILQ